ncbi:hypothetical protein ACS0TY_030703 [Phlomoides rotata]
MSNTFSVFSGGLVSSLPRVGSMFCVLTARMARQASLVDDGDVLDLGKGQESGFRSMRWQPICLMGKLCSKKPANVFAIIDVMTNAFKPKSRLTARDWGNGLIVFSFGTVLGGHEQPSYVQITTTSFWVRAYDVPLCVQTEDSIRAIASRVGLLECFERPSNLMPLDFLRFKVELDIIRNSLQGVVDDGVSGPAWRIKRCGASLFDWDKTKFGYVLKEVERCKLALQRL